MNGAQHDLNVVYVPKCSFSGVENGVWIEGYNEFFCSADTFEITFNEYGVCYTFNNYNQLTSQYFAYALGKTVQKHTTTQRRDTDSHKQKFDSILKVTIMSHILIDIKYCVYNYKHNILRCS